MPQGASRSPEEATALSGDMAFVEPGLTEAWSWRPDGGPLAPESDVMTLLAGVASKD